MPESQSAHVAYRAVLFAAALLVLGLLFRQLATLLLALLMTVIISIPLSAGATRLERYGIPRGVGPIASIGLSVAGVVGALILMLITAYYIAVRPGPLVEGALRLVPPSRRAHARWIMERLRTAWIGWMKGVVIHMFLSGTLLYIGL